jgi:N-acyl homoserine lactone hydrolase
MITSASSPHRLYLMQVATITIGPFTIPVPCYLIQTKNGKNILIDSGFPRTEKTKEVREDAVGRSLVIEHRKDVIEQLAMIGVRPSNIDLLICTHYDNDHAGNNAAFPNARFVAQRLQHEVASAGDLRFADVRSQWDQPLSRYQFVDGDAQLLPDIELIETSGHVPGHQSVLVSLPQTGTVLLAIDAVAIEAHFTADRPVDPTEVDGAEAIASTRKLLDLVQRKHVSLVIFGHDSLQWSTLKQLPDFFS